MPFENGHEKVGGRKPGSPNKKTLLRAAFVLADMGISPTERLVEIADDPQTPIPERVELWKFLQSYVEAPQVKPTEVAAETPEGSVERAKAMAAQLAELSKPIEPPKP